MVVCEVRARVGGESMVGKICRTGIVFNQECNSVAIIDGESGSIDNVKVKSVTVSYRIAMVGPTPTITFPAEWHHCPVTGTKI